MIKTQKLPEQTFVHRSPIFYGWIVWAVATLGLVASAPGQSFTISLFIDHFITDFNMDRTTVSGLYGLGTFTASLALTWVGRNIDKHGNRRVSGVIGLAFVIALMGMSLIAGPLTLLIGFIAVRGLGQGGLGLSNTTAIAQWFKRRRGFMLSLSIVIFSGFQFVYIPWLQRTLESTDWRQVWLMLGAGVAVVTVLMWLFIRDRPEDYHLLPDGEVIPPLKEGETAPPALVEDNWTLGEAQQTIIFWVFLGGRFLLPAWGTGLVLHQISIFGELGHSPLVAAQTFSMLALLTAGTSLLSGFIIDRLRPGFVMMIQLGALVLTLLMAMVMTASWMLFVYALLFAAAQGMSAAFDGMVWPNLFGRQHQGTIRGFVSTILVTGTAVGPVLFGLSYDQFGSYTPVLWLGIALTIPPMIASLFMDQPRHRT